MCRGDCCPSRTCDLAQKVARIRVPIDVFERTIIDAFDTIGYNLRAPTAA